ncbi:MAG: imidazole glycerol phosphate synthase subunit HisF [Desulfurella sp.]|uniref:imidazole glycerol phosphate synthase subunit HisF n=1 Tax=Desulfurella sp. TaxID=1962857 RepID=UPI003D0A24A1
MLAKRIIPCLDVKEGRVVKGINFVNLKDAGDPVEQAIIYDSQSADELVFLDITASYEKRSIMIDVVSACAQNIFMPLTVGGGIRTIQDIRNLLKAGADKVSINSAAVRNPDFLNEAVKVFGSQCIVVAIDAKKIGNDFYVFIDGGRVNTNKKVIDWLIEVQERGAGEILLTSMDKDGTKEGYDLELTKLVCENSTIPVIASGGAGKMEHIKQVFEIGADAALAASIFHFGEISIQETKKYLSQNNINVRI